MNAKTILSLFGLVTLLAVACPRAACQTGDLDLEQRVFNLGILRTGKLSTKSDNKRVDPKLLLAQVQEDFTKLQTTNNELAEANEKTENLDLDFVKTAVTDIHTRGERLMENLTESKTKLKEIQSIPTDRMQLKKLISTLDDAVGEFAHNRVFKEASADDDKLAKKALRDLDQIIALSAQILKGADSLKKLN